MNGNYSNDAQQKQQFYAKAQYDFCRTAALELADRGVRVNAVSDEKC